MKEMAHKHICPGCEKVYRCTIPYCNGVARRLCNKCEKG